MKCLIRRCTLSDCTSVEPHKRHASHHHRLCHALHHLQLRHTVINVASCTIAYLRTCRLRGNHVFVLCTCKNAPAPVRRSHLISKLTTGSASISRVLTQHALVQHYDEQHSTQTTEQSCVECEAGKYSALVGLWDPFQCRSCPSGFAQNLAGQAFCLPCVPGKYGKRFLEHEINSVSLYEILKNLITIINTNLTLCAVHRFTPGRAIHTTL